MRAKDKRVLGRAANEKCGPRCGGGRDNFTQVARNRFCAGFFKSLHGLPLIFTAPSAKRPEKGSQSHFCYNFTEFLKNP